MKNKLLYAGLVAALGLGVQGAFAAAKVVTIFDGASNPVQGSWYRAASGADVGEDNEVEWPAHKGQQWDLEAMVFDGDTYALTVIGGYDLKNGHQGYMLGDIFLDTNNSITPPSQPTPNKQYEEIANNGYEYVIHFTDRVGGDPYGALNSFAYEVVALDINSINVGVWYDQLVHSAPFVYSHGGTVLPYNGAGTYIAGTTLDTDAKVNAYFDPGTGVIPVANWVPLSGDINTGEWHNALTLDLSWIGTEGANLPNPIHLTMGCGNDLLLGCLNDGDKLPDGGTTMLLLGSALAGLSMIRRRQ